MVRRAQDVLSMPKSCHEGGRKAESLGTKASLSRKHLHSSLSISHSFSSTTPCLAVIVTSLIRLSESLWWSDSRPSSFPRGNPLPTRTDRPSHRRPQNSLLSYAHLPLRGLTYRCLLSVPAISSASQLPHRHWVVNQPPNNHL